MEDAEDDAEKVETTSRFFSFLSSFYHLFSPENPRRPFFSSTSTTNRYRVLFSTLLSGDKDIDEGMVSDDKPWVGTRSFGLW